MIKPNQIRVDVRSLGKFYLTAVNPNVKEGTTIGYRYQVACPSLALEKFTIKIDGDKKMDVNDDICEVVFEGLQVSPYVVDGNFGLTGTATGIRVAGANKPSHNA